MNRKIKIAPSILSADFCKLGEQVNSAHAAGADRIHIDVMDGQFVPNISIGLPVVQSLKKSVTIPLESHLMISNPELYVDEFAEAGSDCIIIHEEVCSHLHRCLDRIRELGKKAGVSINPGTPIETLDEVLGMVDVILIMTVNPGFGGQKYIPSMTDKITRMRQKLHHLGLDAVEIEVDGGIDVTTAPIVVKAGADVLVAGSAVFNNHRSVAENMALLLDALEG